VFSHESAALLWNAPLWRLPRRVDVLVPADIVRRRGVPDEHVVLRGMPATTLLRTDAGAESPWETWIRYLSLRAGLPSPRTQLPVEVDGRRYRVDLGWAEDRVLVEFDGRVKYVDGSFGDGYDADRARFEDKVREDVITAHVGVRPLRFTAKDGPDPAGTTATLLRAFPATVRDASRVNPLLPLPGASF
jgi:very-short-patch-repair endonuclease